MSTDNCTQTGTSAQPATIAETTEKSEKTINDSSNQKIPLSQLQTETAKRRTFGIISHPDAGKTTLTEKLLLFGGAIQLAGAVKARKSDRHATSDWMAIEKERGISVTSSVMQFNYNGYEVNLLDTPGHADFSEDTYRVLTAVDSAVMVIDSVKGVEAQTRKLMEVCRMRNTPILTFVNKLDREGMYPLDIMSDIEDKLQIECAPLTWPIGMGKTFKGTYNLYEKELNLFTPGQVRRTDKMTTITDLSDPLTDELLGKQQADDLREDIELLEGASSPFILDDYLKGSQTPVFFGSAINNFGVKEMLNAFVKLAPTPRPSPTTTRMVFPTEEAFSGFVFKIQANMNKAHRDRIAFLRVCSGKFEKGMKVRHHRLKKEIKISNPIIFMAESRKLVDEAWPGDIIGIHNRGTIKMGDCFSEKEKLKFTGLPSFAPEFFRRVRLTSPMKAKQLQKGLTQLAEEGAIQVFRHIQGNYFILGAVGVLQIDVTLARLESEYGVEAICEPLNYATARWISCDENPKKLAEFEKANQSCLAHDSTGKLAFMALSNYWLSLAEKDWPEITFANSSEHD